MTEQVLRVSDFSTIPGARYRTDGDWSGEQFREEKLNEAFKLAQQRREKLVVDLDGVEGYATSFLEEAFGGLAREFGIAEVQGTLVLLCEDEPGTVERVLGYIRDANRRSKP